MSLREAGYSSKKQEPERRIILIRVAQRSGPLHVAAQLLRLAEKVKYTDPIRALIYKHDAERMLRLHKDMMAPKKKKVKRKVKRKPKRKPAKRKTVRRKVAKKKKVVKRKSAKRKVKRKVAKRKSAKRKSTKRKSAKRKSKRR